MGNFKFMPSSNRIGFVSDTDLWPTDSMESMDEVDALAMRMERLENVLNQMAPESLKKEMKSGVGQVSDKLMQKVEEFVGEAFDVALDPPDTWKPHLQKKDKAGLVDMEYKELQNALKTDPKNAHKEAVHTMAALMRACL